MSKALTITTFVASFIFSAATLHACSQTAQASNSASTGYNHYTVLSPAFIKARREGYRDVTVCVKGNIADASISIAVSDWWGDSHRLITRINERNDKRVLIYTTTSLFKYIVRNRCTQ